MITGTDYTVMPLRQLESTTSKITLLEGQLEEVAHPVSTVKLELWRLNHAQLVLTV
jgi:hypothetical protein